MFFFKNHAENKAEKLVPGRLFKKKKKSFILGKSNWPAAWFHYRYAQFFIF